MINEIVVSIVCNAYNHEKYIEQTLDSFVRQKTSFKFEVLVHDDASTDGTADVIRRFWKKYPNLIKPIFQKDNQFSKGVNITWDIQLPRASGKYVAFCEGDDYWSYDGKLQKSVEFLLKNPVYSCVLHKTSILDCSTNTFVGYSDSKEDDSDYTFEDALNNMCHTSSFFIKKEILPSSRPSYFNCVKGTGDWPMKLFITLNSRVYYLKKSMSVYRLFSCKDSWSSNNLNPNSNDVLFEINYYKIAVKLFESAKPYIPSFYKKILKDYLNNFYLLVFKRTKNLFELHSLKYFFISLKYCLSTWFK